MLLKCDWWGLLDTGRIELSHREYKYVGPQDAKDLRIICSGFRPDGKSYMPSHP